MAFMAVIEKTSRNVF